MDNHELLPFERNRYYKGKLLTSSDFQTEQIYFNNKRRFLNDLVYGSGVICGLGVYNLDDLSLMIESGVAIDGQGREIVVENSVIKKVSTIDGFENLTSGRAALCLRYREEAVHPIYSISRQADGDEYELNRIREGWELFLADPDTLVRPGMVETDFFSSATLYSDDDFLVEIYMPASVSRDSMVRITVRAEKRSAAARALSLDCLLQTPSFTNQKGERELDIQVEGLTLAEGEETEFCYWLHVGSQIAGESVITARPQNLRVQIDGMDRHHEEAFLLKINLSDEPVDELITQEVGRISLESLEIRGRANYIHLANLELQLTQNAYIIDRVSDRGIKRYIPTVAGEELRREYASFFGSGEHHVQPVAAPPVQQHSMVQEGRPAPVAPELIYASGICEIPLGAKPRRGEIFHSEEIVHGLGSGNVLVEVGFEYLSEDERLSSTAKNVIYGDVDLFATEKAPIAPARTAVKVMNDRGSFVAAVKLLRDTPFVVLLLRWVAIRLPSEEDKTSLLRIAGKSISAEQPTVMLATRESHYFNVKFRNMEPTSLTYELTENDSGEITADGVYTAPGREGVYEIRISCTDIPLISTYAYAIVKKREREMNEAPEKE